jgi:hypothetical protein
MPGIKIGRNKRLCPVIAYTNDVTVFVTHPRAFSTIQQAVQIYERATGASLNTRTSSALAVGA